METVASSVQAGTTVDTTRLQGKTATQEQLEKDLEKDMWTVGFRYS